MESQTFCRQCFAFQSPQEYHACVGVDNLDEIGQCNVKLQRMLESIKQYHIFLSQTAANKPGYGWTISALAFLQQWITAVLQLTEIPESREESARLNGLQNQAEKMMSTILVKDEVKEQWIVVKEMHTMLVEIVREKVSTLTEGLSPGRFAMPEDGAENIPTITHPVFQDEITPSWKIPSFSKTLGQFPRATLDMAGTRLGNCYTRNWMEVPKPTARRFTSVPSGYQGIPQQPQLQDPLSESRRTEVVHPQSSGYCSVPMPPPWAMPVRGPNTALPTTFRNVFEQPVLPTFAPSLLPRFQFQRAPQRFASGHLTSMPSARRSEVPVSARYVQTRETQEPKVRPPVVRRILRTATGEVHDITDVSFVDWEQYLSTGKQEASLPATPVLPVPAQATGVNTEIRKADTNVEGKVKELSHGMNAESQEHAKETQGAELANTPLASDIDGSMCSHCRRRDEAREDMRISMNTLHNDLMSASLPLTQVPLVIPRSRSNSIPSQSNSEKRERGSKTPTPRVDDGGAPTASPVMSTHGINDESDMVTSKWADAYQATVDARLAELQRLTQLSRNKSTLSDSSDILDKTYTKPRAFAA